ncbi:MAG: DUF3450 domain-containing protein [Desulfobacterales bacterium]
MKSRKGRKPKRLYFISALCIVFFLASFAQVIAGSDPIDIHGTVEKEINVRKQMQQLEGKWAEDRHDLAGQYQELESRRSAMEAKKKRLSDQIGLRQKKVSHMQKTLGESDRVKKELQATLEDIAGRLEVFVKNDLPFLESERSGRLKELKTCLIDPDISPGEKTRRTLEAMQVELDYGRRLEVSSENINIDGQKVAVDVLRVGRLSLFCRSSDGSTLGWYVPADQSWQSLAGKHEMSISVAMEIANQQRPADIIKLPLGRLEVQ